MFYLLTYLLTYLDVFMLVLFSCWLCILVYDGPIWSFGSCLSCFYVFFMFLCFTNSLCGCVFFQWHFIDLFSCIAASLFNKLTYLLTYLPDPTWQTVFFALLRRRCGSDNNAVNVFVFIGLVSVGDSLELSRRFNSHHRCWRNTTKQ